MIKAWKRGTVTLEMKLPRIKSRKCDLHDFLMSCNLLNISKSVDAEKTINFNEKCGGIDEKLSGIATKI